MAKKPAFGRGDLPRALVFIPLGVCLLYLTFWLIQDRLGFLSHAERAEGHVSALNSGGSHPQIDFIDAAGLKVSYPESGLIFGYAVGDSVTVLYRAEAPSRTAIIKDRGALWGASLMAGLLGFVFTIGGGYHLAAWFRRRRMVRPV